MKKKLAAAFLTLCMAAGTLAGCGGDSSSASGDTSTTGTEENKTEEKGETTEAQESVKMSAEELKSMEMCIRDSSKAMAMTAVDVLTNPELLEAIRRDFKEMKEKYE